MKKTILAMLVVLMVFSLSLGVANASEPLSGAIFTTDSTGQVVNGNIYANKSDVYLNGGPGPNAPLGAAGLPDGTYYYQITDPSGSRLLAGPFAPNGIPDTSGKIITVSGGAFTSLIQLAPFKNTPNRGGVYKVWVTRVADFAPGSGFFGFIPSLSKTDNFKVKGVPWYEPPSITVGKSYDTNANGGYDSGEPLLSGWKIEVTDLLGVTNYYYTPVALSNLSPGIYTIEEIMPLGNWVQTYVRVDGSYQIPPTTTVFINVVGLSGETHNVLYGNVCLGPGGGHTIGYWQNKNGQAEIGNDDLAFLATLAPFAGPTPWFYPVDVPFTSAQDIADFLTEPAPWATYMQYKLAEQLLAMELNVFNGYVSGSSIIYLGNGQFGTIQAVMNTIVAAYPWSGWSHQLQEFYKNALDDANNNLNFVQPTPCPIVYP